jgi:hypothetical protein
VKTDTCSWSDHRLNQLKYALNSINALLFQSKSHFQLIGLYFYILQHLSYFEYLGRIFGIALRTSILLSLDLPAFFWKQVVGQPVTRKDLQAIDLHFVTTLERLESYRDANEEDRTDFEDNYDGELFFSIARSDGSKGIADCHSVSSFSTLVSFSDILNLFFRHSFCGSQSPSKRWLHSCHLRTSSRVRPSGAAGPLARVRCSNGGDSTRTLSGRAVCLVAAVHLARICMCIDCTSA